MSSDSLAKRIKLYSLGISFMIFLISFIVLSLPIYLYRWIITKIVAPRIGGSLRKPVNISGQALAAEFLKPSNIPTRHSVAVPIIIETHLPFSLLCEEIESNLLNAEDPFGKPKYPEIKQYIESWMGIMFWRQDNNFNLTNHVTLHTLDKTGTNSDSEKFFVQLGEKLLNDPFPRKRSPWEVHLVHNFKNPRTKEDTNVTLIFLRYQHAMGDGFSMANLLRDSFQKPQGNLPEVTIKNKISPGLNLSFLRIFSKGTIYEAGRIASYHLFKKTRYHIPDNKKKWHQFFGRAPAISVAKIKLVKNTFGVSFASVLISSYSAALGKTLLKLEKESNLNEDNLPEIFLLGIPLPKGNRPKKLTNHFSFAVLETSLKVGKNAIERLQECDKKLGKMGKSAAPKSFSLLVNIFGGHLARVAGLALTNRFMGSVMSNFSVSGLEPTWNGHKCSLLDAPVGAIEGVGGVCCCAFSFDDVLQLSATAEAGVMSREDLNKLLQHVYDEIEFLYKMAKKHDQNEYNDNDLGQ